MSATELKPLPEARLPLQGDRGVVLRRHRLADAAEICAQCQDAEMVRFTTVPAPYTLADAEDFLTLVARGWSDGTVAAFAIEVGGRFAGTVDLRMRDGGWAEVGYGLAPWARGRGVMTEAVRLALRWGFEELALAGVHWSAVVGNDPSRRVAEKVGFRIEGHVRGLLVHRGERVDGWLGSLLVDDLR